MTYLEKAEQIGEGDRKFARSELASIAERLRQSYPDMNFSEVNLFLHQMLDVSV